MSSTVFQLVPSTSTTSAVLMNFHHKNVSWSLITLTLT